MPKEDPLRDPLKNKYQTISSLPKNTGSDAIKDVKKTGAEDNSKSQRPNPLRRSFDRPPSVARLQKTIITPGPGPSPIISASFSSNPTTAPKVTMERVAVAKMPNAEKLKMLSSSRSRSRKKTPSPSPTTKRGSTSSSASKKPPGGRDKKEAQNLETKHENKENSDHQIEEVVVKDDQGEIDGIQITKAEETKHPDVVDTTQVKSVEEVEEGKETHGHNDISTVPQEHNKEPRTEEMEDKFHEEKSDGSNNNQHDEDKENHRHSKEQIIVGRDHQEKILHEKTKIETKDVGVEEGYTTGEVGGEEKTDEGSEQEQGLESIKEEIVEWEVEESEAEAANLVAKSRVQEAQAAGHGKKEFPTPYNDVIEETASKLLEERKNKVRALVGAFETVIDKETSNA